MTTAATIFLEGHVVRGPSRRAGRFSTECRPSGLSLILRKGDAPATCCLGCRVGTHPRR